MPALSPPDSHPGQIAQQVRAPLPDLLLRPMAADDLGACHRLSLRFKWPHRLEDWDFLLQMGQGYLLEDTASDAPLRIVGSVVCTPYGEHHAVIGMLLVQAELQRRGLGRRLMQHAASQVSAHSLMVNATAAGMPLYKQLGFVQQDVLHQFQGASAQPVLVSLPPGERVRPMGKNDVARLLELDAQASGMDRSKLLLALLEISEGVALDRDGEMLGFALVRRFGHGRVIGPVVAPDTERAKGLIAHWINTYSDSFIRIDVFESTGLPTWLDKLGVTCVDHVTRMCKGTPPVHNPDMQLFSIVNQALG
ncbi:MULTISPECIES: GNAT family N-acetyltransferase [Herbaspirillum]|jgi:ribosomal protein S18 acetylase RimI-like enzyme|uniref:N-acetyltransferase n=1 Tax=Herbaspirillum rubrisubalbicans Os34 TaxID=1235827 RepID=A0A6M3ZMZ6_9BURK|nr:MULTISPECIES: GNAT family N-acetyltransferase [Herbaspirillum]MCP1576417.1 ribosomal protein S18 acetylase RimI-like enzyme [Herbaspirillum rubrisubalbicans]NQE50016.1 GCN5 family acetyltransferase [Herbaspirillum rubrisubalbicans]QJP99652.1 N-acetyltransferase [Herbaspirillum rubrisubalbicans Os34]